MLLTKKWTDLTLKDAVGNKLVVYDGANDLAKAELEKPN
jgi:hypothetical protein